MGDYSFLELKYRPQGDYQYIITNNLKMRFHS